MDQKANDAFTVTIEANADDWRQPAILILYLSTDAAV